ncbi:MAG: hypothetical protein ACTSVM_03265 [Candidatus Ranarchaeia archaeon]
MQQNILAKFGSTVLRIQGFPLWRWSIFNSPYYSHQKASGIDLYPFKQSSNQLGKEDPLLVPSPITGKIIYHDAFHAPLGYKFKAEKEDHVLVVEPDPREYTNVVFRLLHVDPLLRVGEKIKAGQTIGRLVHSGFFSSWTEPHLHLEMRPSSPETSGNLGQWNATAWKRAKGAIPLTSLEYTGHWPKQEAKHEKFKKKYEFTGRCITKLSSSLFLNIDSSYWIQVGAWHGFPVWVGSRLGFLDAGLPYYKIGGVIHRPDNHHEKNNVSNNHASPIIIGDCFEIGVCIRQTRGFSVFKPKPIMTKVNEVLARGISFFVYRNTPCLKVIAVNKGDFDVIRCNEKVQVTLMQPTC